MSSPFVLYVIAGLEPHIPQSASLARPLFLVNRCASCSRFHLFMWIQFHFGREVLTENSSVALVSSICFVILFWRGYATWVCSIVCYPQSCVAAFTVSYKCTLISVSINESLKHIIYGLTACSHVCCITYVLATHQHLSSASHTVLDHHVSMYKQL